MQRWDPLGERQLLLLKRIAEGDDLSSAEGVSFRTSARGLQSRRLVTVSRHGGMWRAAITEAGRFYLQHGYHPDHPDRRETDPSENASAPRIDRARPTPATGVLDQAAALIERLHAEGGTLTIESPEDDTRALYRRIIHAAKQHMLVPAGFQLKHTGRGTGDLIIRLSEDSVADETGWNRIRLNTRRVTSDPSLLFQAIEKDPANLNVTESSLPRALDLIRSLAAEARLRGHRLGVNTKTKHPRLYLQIGDDRRAVNLREEYDSVRHVPTKDEQRELRRNPWARIPEYDQMPSGRLRLEVSKAGHDQHDRWTDDTRMPLETRLPRVIRDVEATVAAEEEARQEARRRHEEYLAEQQRKEEEQRLQWQATLDQARPKATEAMRRKAFRAAYDAWVAAEEMRAFCDALAQAASPEDDPGVASNRANWTSWARAAADRIDPTAGDTGLTAVPFDAAPEPDDLRPYIGDWSPHQPRREYRYERDEERLADARRQGDTWHHGMRGRPSWWRKR
jgi:hypothetical protein